MKEVGTVVLENDRLCDALEAESAKTGRSVQELVAEALEQWLADVDTDERDMEKIEAARTEWQEKGGVEAHEFFQELSRGGRNGIEECHTGSKSRLLLKGGSGICLPQPSHRPAGEGGCEKRYIFWRITLGQVEVVNFVVRIGCGASG